MRLVSVVVPDCEMATTSVSLMSAVSPNPESSVAVSASIAIGAGPERFAQHAGEAPARDVRAPLPDHEHAPDRAGLQPAEDRGRERLGRSRTSSRPSRSTMRPRNVLRNEAGASAISLRR